MPVGAHIQVDGLREVLRDLRKLGDQDTPKMIRRANLEAAKLVVPVAKVKAPKRTGKLAASVGARATRKAGSIKAGSPVKVPYAGPIHFGWPARNIRPQPFLYEAADERINEVRGVYEARLNELIRGFNGRP